MRGVWCVWVWYERCVEVVCVTSGSNAIGCYNIDTSISGHEAFGQ